MSQPVFPRKVHSKISQLLHQHSIVLVHGALGTGKTSFLKEHFGHYDYISLKNKNHCQLLKQDPYRFFNLYAGKTMFDDIEEVPGFTEQITSYSLSIYQSGNYILISNVFQQAESSFIHACPFYPLDLQEMKNARTFKLTLEGNCVASALPGTVNYKKHLEAVFTGPFASLVRIRDKKLLFDLLRACAEQVNQPLNLNAIAKKIGVSQPSVQSWLNAFEKCGLVRLLPALEKSFQKRVIKSPKLYFMDCGLLSYLLGLKSPEDLLKSPYFIPVYHNLVFTELFRKNEADSHPKPLHYWKESNGHEIPFLVENPTSYDIYEVVSAHEVSKKDFRELDFFDEISEGKVLSRNIIYGGYKNFSKNEVNIISWQAI
ncbi:MAG: family ATPase [Crocinitomicaceae bacterium]|jgi:predicted AAA+ superfamily ATPase|nr:family ATPase [Crocinitomicaceae bacterium]